MSKGTLVGFSLLIGGIVIWIAYGFYLSFEEIMKLDLITGIIIGLILIGLIILFVSIVIEQRRDTEKMKKDIKKEDLEP